MASAYRVPQVKPLKGPFKPNESLQTQAAINYAVKCATASQKEIGKNDNDTIFNVPNVAEEIDQHAILLTRKIKPGTIAPSFTHLGTFTRLNMLKDKSPGNSYDARRHELMNDLSFAGVAFVNVSKENATKTGAIGMFASQHGGTTTVRSMNADHVRDRKFLPGTVVRWTLPRNPNPDDAAGVALPHGWKNPPIEWSMKACEKAIFAELEEVKPINVLQDVYVQYLMNGDSKLTVDAAITQYDAAIKPLSATFNDIQLAKNIITAYIQLESRIVGTVVSDDGQGSISMRLR